MPSSSAAPLDSVFGVQSETIKRQLEPLVEPFVHRLELLNINVTQFELPHGVRLPAVFRQDNSPRPGRELRKRGAAPKHPVIIVPGFVTSGLELWHGVECAIPKYFRCGHPASQQSCLGPKGHEAAGAHMAVVRLALLQALLQCPVLLACAGDEDSLAKAGCLTTVLGCFYLCLFIDLMFVLYAIAGPM